jgi:two-component system response regulator AlgR
LEGEFGPRFRRIHRNALVAVAYLQGLQRTPQGFYEAVLADIEEPLPVSRRQAGALRRFLKAR